MDGYRQSQQIFLNCVPLFLFKIYLLDPLKNIKGLKRYFTFYNILDDNADKTKNHIIYLSTNVLTPHFLTRLVPSCNIAIRQCTKPLGTEERSQTNSLCSWPSVQLFSGKEHFEYQLFSLRTWQPEQHRFGRLPENDSFSTARGHSVGVCGEGKTGHTGEVQGERKGGGGKEKKRGKGR